LGRAEQDSPGKFTHRGCNSMELQYTTHTAHKKTGGARGWGGLQVSVSAEL